MERLLGLVEHQELVACNWEELLLVWAELAWRELGHRNQQMGQQLEGQPELVLVELPLIVLVGE